MSTVDIRCGQLFSQKSHEGVPIFTVDIFTLNMSTVDMRWGQLFSQRGAHFHCKYEYPGTHILRNICMGIPIFL